MSAALVVDQAKRVAAATAAVRAIDCTCHPAVNTAPATPDSEPCNRCAALAFLENEGTAPGVNLFQPPF